MFSHLFIAWCCFSMNAFDQRPKKCAFHDYSKTKNAKKENEVKEKKI